MPRPDRMTDAELAEEATPLLVPGRPYLFVMGFGWSIVAFYVRHETPLTIRVAHANHFRNAHKDYGLLITEGAGDDCEWRYEGRAHLSVTAIQRITTYAGEVPRARIRTT